MSQLDGLSYAALRELPNEHIESCLSLKEHKRSISGSVWIHVTRLPGTGFASDSTGLFKQ